VPEVAAAGEDHRQVVAVGRSIAISSRIEPPGWMIAVMPAAAAAWMPSGNGSRRPTP
jgi:hypothetical protein